MGPLRSAVSSTVEYEGLRRGPIPEVSGCLPVRSSAKFGVVAARRKHPATPTRTHSREEIGDTPTSILGAYIASLRGASGTVTIRRLIATEFIEWCSQTGLHFPDVTSMDILEFEQHLARNKRNKKTTISTKLRGLIHMYRWMIANDVVSTSPLERFVIPRVEVKPMATLSLEELRSLWTACPTPRHRAVVGLLGFMGLTVDDVCSADLSDIKPGKPYARLALPPRSGAREEIQALIPAQLLDVILAMTSGRTTGPIVTTLDGGRLTRSACLSIVRIAARAAELGRPVSSKNLTYSLRALALQHGFSYLGTIAATGEIGASRGRRWVPTRQARPEQHAAIRLAHLLFDDPESPASMLFEAGVVLTESALPPAVAVMTAGAALERHLRSLARARGIQFAKPENQLQLSSYISRLVETRVVHKADHGLLTSVEHHRNDAAHGWFERVTIAEANEVLSRCLYILERYPAS